MRRWALPVALSVVAVLIFAACTPLTLRYWVARDFGGCAACGGQVVRVSPDGTKVFVTGTGLGNHSDYNTVAYSASKGARLWAESYDGPAGGNDRASGLVVSPTQSKIYVTGTSYDNDNYHYATVAYDSSNGTQLWTARYNGPASVSDDAPSSIALSPDETKVYVTGRSANPTSQWDYATVAYDASNGNQLWVARYNNVTNGYSQDGATSLGVSPDGTKVFVTGMSYGATSGSDYATVAYDSANGNQVWVKRYNSPDAPTNDDIARSLGVSPDGTKVYVTGTAWSATALRDYVTFAYDTSTGAQLWSTHSNTVVNGKDINDEASSLVVSPDGGKVYITGTAAGYATVALDAFAGNQLWATRYPGPAEAHSLAVTPDGTKLFVTGTRDGGSSTFRDFATVAYDTSDGRQVQTTRFNGPLNQHDDARSVAISPDGTRVFVTGQGDAPTSSEHLTVAYNAVNVE